MTESFPNLNARQAMKAVEHLGFILDRQRGSHAFYRHPFTKHIVTIPVHSGDLKRKTITSIIKQTGCSREEFLAAVK